MSETTVSLNHRVEGEGPWITLAHSLASDMRLLEAQAKLLAKRFRVLRLDIRGHGGSPVAAPPYSMPGLAADVQALFDKLGIQQTAWLGVSLGGMIGLTHAIAHPGVITRMVVADTTSGYPEAAHAGWRDRIAAVRERGTQAVVDGTLSRWFTPGFAQREPALLQHFAAMIAATPADGFIGCCEAILGYNIDAELSRIRVPVLVMVGDQDQATPPAMAQKLAEGIPGAQHHVIASAAHQASVEQPDAFNARLEQFLAE